jgi:mannose-1-phosphate guanylyltransferase
VKAVILAGGQGTRGRPYTEYFPKAMIPIFDKPLIHYIVKYLSSSKEISEIIVLSDYEGLGDQIKNYLENLDGIKKIKFVQDSHSGTGGDLLHLAKNLKGESKFLLWFVDNLCALDISKMTKRFSEKKSMACIATRTMRKEETGFAVVKDGIISEFIEKPTMRLAMPECLGIYVLDSKILKKINAIKEKQINLSYHILENLSKEGKISSFDIEDTPWLDVESPVIIERNSKVVKQIIKQMGF